MNNQYQSSAYYYNGPTFNAGFAPKDVSMAQAHSTRREMVTPSQDLAPVNFHALQVCKPRLVQQSYSGSSSLSLPNTTK